MTREDVLEWMVLLGNGWVLRDRISALRPEWSAEWRMHKARKKWLENGYDQTHKTSKYKLSAQALALLNEVNDVNK